MRAQNSAVAPRDAAATGVHASGADGDPGADANAPGIADVDAHTWHARWSERDRRKVRACDRAGNPRPGPLMRRIIPIFHIDIPQILSKSKAFSDAPTTFAAAPNSQVRD